MPISGLPTMLENIINGILNESTLVSYKMCGFKNRSTLVLRFDTMADNSVSPVHRSSPVNSFRRKSPCQLQRDKRRQQEYRSTLTKENKEKLAFSPEKNKISSSLLSTELTTISTEESKDSALDSLSLSCIAPFHNSDIAVNTRTNENRSSSINSMNRTEHTDSESKQDQHITESRLDQDGTDSDCSTHDQQEVDTSYSETDVQKSGVESVHNNNEVDTSYTSEPGDDTSTAKSTHNNIENQTNEARFNKDTTVPMIAGNRELRLDVSSSPSDLSLKYFSQKLDEWLKETTKFKIDNAVSIPYHEGLAVGNAVDFTGKLARGAHLVTDGTTPDTSKIDTMTCKFSLASSFAHVCEVLDIPPEYALKVEAGLLQNDVVKTCLTDIYNKQAFKLIFRLRYIQELRHYLNPMSKRADDSLENDGDGQGIAVLKSDPNSCQITTHMVDTLYIGDEFIVIMKISTAELDALQTFHKKIEQMLGGRSGSLGKDAMITTLEKLGKSLENKLGKTHYKHVKAIIQYGSYSDLDEYPGSMGGMVQLAKHYTTKWEKMSSPDADVHININITTMTVTAETDQAIISDVETLVKAKEMLSPSKDVFHIRVTLQPTHREDKSLPQDYSPISEAIFSYIYALNRTGKLIEEFLKSHDLFSNLDYKLEGEEICSRVQQRKTEMVEAIQGFTMVKPLSTCDKQLLQEMVTDLPDMVENFIKKVTTTLPKGGDLNFLIIGKTGHGKSSTANTILWRREFSTSSGGISQTKNCQRGWSEIDGRTFKVVDVPGVCDTDLNSVESVKLAMTCISEAITTCSEGFHALLLVIRYGNRMTEEEERAIYILKCILGQTIVHSHCICVVTHGDNFEENEGLFEDWCKRQEGFLKEVFEECDYRCVLFNNKTTDPSILKTQMIKLVSKVDNLEHRGSCYTNNIFKHAERDRQRLIEELELPEFKEDFMRDLNLLQGDFEAIENATGDERIAKLEKLKNSTESLKLKLDSLKCGGITDIFQAVSSFSERLHRQEEKELADTQLQLERERFKQEEARLKAEREIMERQVREETEQRIREAALAAERERELEEERRKNQEEKESHQQEVQQIKSNMANNPKKKSRWVKFRDSALGRP